MDIISMAAVMSIALLWIGFNHIDADELIENRGLQAILLLVINLLHFTTLLNPAVLFVLSGVVMVIFILPEFTQNLEKSRTVSDFMLVMTLFLILSIVPMQNILTFIL